MDVVEKLDYIFGVQFWTNLDQKNYNQMTVRGFIWTTLTSCWVEKCGHFDHKSLLQLTKVDLVKSFDYIFRVQFWTY